MAVRTKTRRRLLNLLIVLVGLCLLTGGAYMLRNRQVAARIVRDRDAGYAALQIGEYFSALHKIGPFVQRHPNDPDSLWKYAIARCNVEEPNGKHISQAIGLYRRVLELNPGNVLAREQLLDLYVATRFNTEILSMTEGREDAASLRARAIALSNLGRGPESQQLALKYNQLAPSDLPMQMFTCAQVLRGGGASASQQVLDRATQLQKSHPDDPRFQLLMGYVLAATGKSQEALIWTRRASSATLTDPELVDAIVEQFDRLDQYEQSLKVLDQAANVQGNLAFRRSTIQRLYQSARYAQVVQRTAELETDTAKADTELLALRAMSLLELNRDDEARKIAAVLGARANDFAAAGWSGFIAAIPRRDAIRIDLRQMIDACREGLKSRPNNPYFRLRLGDAYAQLGESQAAMRQWTMAAQIAPVWAAPQARILRVLADADAQQAQKLADHLAQLAPDEPAVQSVVAYAYARGLNSPDSARLDPILARLDRAGQLQGGEESSLNLKVVLLAAAGRRDAALAVINQQLHLQDPPASRQTLLSLAQASQSARLGAEQSCLNRCRELYGVSLPLAGAQTAILLRAGNNEQAIKSFQSDREKSGNPADITWQLAWLRLLDSVSDPRAPKLWAELSDAQPDDPAIQQAVITSRQAQTDRALIRRAIDRLGKIVGEDGIAWQLADARWIMQGAARQSSPSQREQEFTKAAAELNDVIRRYSDLLPARLLLAECLFRLNNKQAAADQLTAAAKLSPASPELCLQLASLLQSMGDFDRAKSYLQQTERILQAAQGSTTQPATSPDTQEPGAAAISSLPPAAGTSAAWRTLAELYAARGETDRAIAILRKLDDAGASDAAATTLPSDTTLLELLSHRGMLDEQMCQKLLAQPTPRTIAIVADYYASVGRLDQAEKTIALLDQVKTSSPGEIACIRGLYLRRRGMTKEAAEQMRLACSAAPANRQWWRALVVTWLEGGFADDAITAARDAARAVPDDANLRRILDNEALVRAVIDIAPARSLLATLPAASESSVPTIVSALSVMRDGRLSNKTVLQIAAELRPLADREPSLMPLQNLLIDMDLAVHNYDEAALLASRSMQLAPNDPAPAQRAAEALAAAGKWDQVLSTAQEWRTRLGPRPLPADQVLAGAYLATRNYAAAQAQLKPYLSQATADPASWAAFYSLYARSLAGAGKIPEALAFFEPALTVNPALRRACVDTALAAIADAQVVVRWIDRVSQVTPPDAVDEQLSLIAARVQLSRRANVDAAIRDSASAKLKELAARFPTFKPLAAGQWIALGAIQELAGDDAAAGASYRAALQINADEPIAQNNLAMVIVRRDGDLNEAAALATKASAHPDHPGQADFLDTLAQVQMKLNHPDPARVALEQASRLRPQDLSIRVNLVRALIQGGKTKESRQAFAELEQLVGRMAQPDPQIVQRIDKLRNELGKSSASN